MGPVTKKLCSPPLKLSMFKPIVLLRYTRKTRLEIRTSLRNLNQVIVAIFLSNLFLFFSTENNTFPSRNVVIAAKLRSVLSKQLLFGGLLPRLDLDITDVFVLKHNAVQMQQFTGR